ncbi:RNA polymerase II degradation factor 1 [Andrographis paniculata]|uniref:RNA polymerase II degradation factor 1 n=1 Tax=Andrographis paniculata TaxID=175694 RepID=UPI0021E94C54|nr:RNA polymerase II degradation factor 1 [Andrographis paniculata]
MEAPPPPLSAPIPTTTTSAAGAAAAAPYPDSLDSSPRSRHTDSWETDPPPPQKLRLMCSYGGHIVPRPHDKTLCYIGGDTRIIVVDRHTSLADLHHRLSKTLLHNNTFSLKYQLPNEDLDSLISVTTDEDLDNMIDEYDRLHSSGAAGLKPGRLRLFLFPKSPPPAAAASIEQLLVETASTKSDDWFFNVLNGKTSDRGFSESSSVNCLLGLDDDSVGKASAAAAADPQNEGSKNGGNNTVPNHDVHSVPDSPMLETTSSFGSTSSSPSVANLPPIRVKVDDNRIEDQFQQMTVGVTGNVAAAAAPPPLQRQEEVGGFVATGVDGGGVVVSGDYRVVSDDERSDHGGYRKVQQIQPQVQVMQAQQQIPPQYQQMKQTGAAIDFPSPDSVSSEGSIQLSRQRQAMYQESIMQMQSGNPKPSDQNTNKIQMQPQIQESGFGIPAQFDPSHSHAQLHHPQQFIHAGNQYIPAGAMPVPSYYSIYPPHHQQQQQPQHPHQPMLDQQYPIYFVTARPPQAYNIPTQQSGYTDLAAPAGSRPQTPTAPVLTSHAGYTQAINAPSSKPEMASGVYRTAAAPGGAPQILQIPLSQQQAQYVGFPQQVHHPSQSMAPSSAANANYEFADPAHAQMYYTQALPPQLAAQYQTMTAAPSGVGPDVSAPIPADNVKQQVRNLPQ